MKNLTKTLIFSILISLLLSGCQSKEMKKAKEFMDAQKYDEAISLLEIETHDNPKNAEASFLLGQCMLKTENEKEAEELFKRAIFLDKDYKTKIGEYFYGQALSLYDSKDYYAKDYYAEDYYYMAIRYDTLGKDKFVKDMFELAKTKAETTPDAHHIIYLFKTVLKLDTLYYEEIASVCMKNAKKFIKKDFINDGVKLGEFSIEIDPKQKKPVAKIYYELAQQYEKNNKISKLLTLALKASTLDTTYLDYYKGIEKKYTKGTFTDNRDGKIYKWVRIGEQIWMAENLNYKTNSGSWCYKSKNINCETYGLLYNWKTAKNACPTGWHLPSNFEWTELTDYIAADGHSGTKGTALKATSGWNSDGNGTDDYGFSALPGGYRDLTNGSFYDAGSLGYWWSSTEYVSSDAWTRYLTYTNARGYRGNDDYDKSRGFSVRCVRD